MFSACNLTLSLQVWDVTRGEKVGSLVGHENRVSCLGVSNDGISLCTGSWDSLVSDLPPGCQARSSEIALTSYLVENMGILKDVGYKRRKLQTTSRQPENRHADLANIRARLRLHVMGSDEIRKVPIRRVRSRARKTI